MAHGTRWKLLTRDERRVLSGDLGNDAYHKAEFVLRHNDAGSWVIDGIPADAPAAAVLDFAHVAAGLPGGHQGIVLYRDDAVLCNGPIRRAELLEDAGVTIRASGVSDTGVLADRIILPDPAGAFSSASHDEVANVPAEEALRWYVDRHAGATAATYGRGIYSLTLGPYSGLGGLVSKSFRFTNLLTALQEIALGGGLRFNVVQTGPGPIEFRVDAVADLRARVVFSADRGTLTQAVRVEDAPAANYVYVLGQGELKDRVIDERGDTASMTRYGRVETTVDQRQTGDTDVLSTALTEALEAGAASVAVTLKPDEAEGAEFGVNYHLGDRVSAIVAGYEVEGYVSEVRIVLDETGETITPTVTTTAIAPSTRSRLRTQGVRIAHLERNAETATHAAGVNGFAELWVGTIGAIPTNYALYDGAGGIHDFRNRFLLGAGGDYAPGATGGTAMVSGGVLVNLQHQHAIEHTHEVEGTTGVVLQAGSGGGQDLDTTVNLTHGGSDKVARQLHTHAGWLAGTTTQDVETSGNAGSTTQAITPPLIGVAVIYRIA